MEGSWRDRGEALRAHPKTFDGMSNIERRISKVEVTARPSGGIACFPYDRHTWAGGAMVRGGLHHS